MGVLKKVNRTPVSAKLLGEALELHADMDVKDRPVFEARVFHLIEFLKAKGFSGNRHSDLVLAINFRLMALARLVQGDQVKGWTMPCREEDATYLHSDVIRAAAKEALIEDEDGPAAFDANSFAHRVLQISKAKGRA